ncbi:MAG: hypothetical protein ACRDTA_28590 [Pseudonocardiaceae bacterium]
MVALLLGTVSGNAGEDITASAFGIAADGLIDIDPTPYVEAPPDEREALLEVPGNSNGDSDGINIALFKVKAQDFRSKAVAVDVDVLGIEAELIEATCENGKGDSSILGGDSGNGTSLPSDPFEGQELDLSPVLSIEFNRQHRDRDKLTVDALVVKLLPGDDIGTVIQQKDLDLLKKVAPKQLKVPATMDEVKSGNSPESSTPANPSAPVNPGAPGAPANPSQPGPATLGDLANTLKSLNPNLVPKADGDDDALLEIVISSASCREDRKKDEKPDEAPKPKPVEADLPVTH